ncbi:hypothetical protein C2G38_405457 [Gigaspora rosea]|uniref:Crinkler effector protein N-terminal domain-containing protein n=1 Tax=Gigaspora rosea TaxID=44941 RepID=A0A397UBV7_9GLOM|nr:hypothetical protein C2G38_405457 [Gigaspora rosea]
MFLIISSIQKKSIKKFQKQFREKILISGPKAQNNFITMYNTTDITVFCFVVGTEVESVFQVEGQAGMSISKLREVIYEKNKNYFKNFDANQLSLWKVDIPYDAENDKFVKLRTLESRSHNEDIILQELEGQELTPIDDFGDIFAHSDLKNIHIIVQPPPPATTVSSTYIPSDEVKIEIKNKVIKAFPNVNESLIDPLVYVLALIWDIEAGENDSPGPQKDPYVNLKAEPSFFKARLPRGITKQTHTTVDLCLPSYESGTVSYHNPFYDDPQFKETVSFVKEKIENNIRDIIVLAGVSGGGKTATTFGIAVQRWSIYIDFSPSIGTYGDHVGKELIKTKIKQPKFEQHDQQDHVFRMLDTVILSRGLLLIKMLIEKNILTPKEWLFAQLRMNDNKIRMKLADENYDIFKVNSLIESIKTCRNVESLTLIFDEAQVLCRSEYGEYKGSSVPNKKWNLLQVYVEHLTHLPVTCLLAGTYMLC